jgi:hypothetical protein
MSPTEICNQALAHLGDTRINSIDGTETRETICRTFYTQAKRELLSTIPWTFARKRTILSTLSQTPAFKWGFQASLPGDCIRVLTVHSGDSDEDPSVVTDTEIDQFEVSDGSILSNHNLVGIYYVADVVNTAGFQPQFIAALARLLASYISASIDGDVALGQSQRMIYETVDLPRAQYLDQVQDQSNENSEVEFNKRRSPLIRARYRGNTGTTFR